jgi:hypothetical protein
MAIQTYSELQTAVANWLGRDDLTARIPEFIDLAEARLSRELETREQEKRATVTTTANDQYIALPTGLREIRHVQLNTSPRQTLRYVSPDQIEREYTGSVTGKPRVYTVVGKEMKIAPTPDTTEYTIELTYIDGLDALSDGNTNNWVLTRYPDAYLYSSLSAASIYLVDDQRAAGFEALAERAIEEIKLDEQRARIGGAPAMRSNYGELT